MRKFILAILLSAASVPAFATDLSITVGNVKVYETATKILVVRYGETVTAGMPVYKKTSDSEYYKADANNTSAEALCAGIALVGGVDNGYGVIVTSGEMDLGATLTVGAQYLVSDTAGGIYPQADVSTGDFISSLGVTVATGKFIVNIKNTGYQAP